MEPSFVDAVEAVIAGLQPGEVMAYGEVAAEAGFPGAARAVGTVLRHSEGLPWWRVVHADGRLASGKPDAQRRHLENEGLRVIDGRVIDGRARGGR